MSRNGNGRSGNRISQSTSKPHRESAYGKDQGRYGHVLKGLFADGQWQCDCEFRLPANLLQVQKNTENRGRWFYGCQLPENERCDFFLWQTDAQVRERKALATNSNTEPRSQAVLATKFGPKKGSAWAARQRSSQNAANAAAAAEAASQSMRAPKRPSNSGAPSRPAERPMAVVPIFDEPEPEPELEPPKTRASTVSSEEMPIRQAMTAARKRVQEQQLRESQQKPSEPERLPREPQQRSKERQQEPKQPSRALQELARDLQEPPRGPRNNHRGSRQNNRGPQQAPRGPQQPPRGPRQGGRGPQQIPREPQHDSRAHQEPPRDRQHGPRGRQQNQRGPQQHQKASQQDPQQAFREPQNEPQPEPEPEPMQDIQLPTVEPPQAMREPQTPQKRTFSAMNETGLPTPQTEGSNARQAEQTPNDKRRMVGSSGRMSPPETPTPARFRDVTNKASETPLPPRFRDATNSPIESTLFDEIRQVLTSHGRVIPAATEKELKEIADRHALRAHGIFKGREISRLAKVAREKKIAELEGQKATLEAELEKERAIIRLLRSDSNSHDMNEEDWL